MTNNVDIARIMSDHKRRQRTKDSINAHNAHQTFMVPVSGTAGTAISYGATQEIRFDVAFRPTQGRDQGINPAFSFGFEMAEDGVVEDTTIISGLIGHAKVARWIRTREGYFTGAIVHIGVVNMTDGANQDTPFVPFTGMCHLHFVGRAITLMDADESDF